MYSTHEEVYHWLNSHNIDIFSINEDLSVDAENVYLMGKYLVEIPVRFNHIRGNFDCSSNNILSLEGVLNKLDRSCNVSGNRLSTLEHLPKVIHGNLNCSVNKITSLLNGPMEVKGSLSMSYNPIASFEGCPDVHGNITAFDTNIISLKGLKGSFKKVLLLTKGGELEGCENLPKERHGRVLSNVEVRNILLKEELNNELLSKPVKSRGLKI